MAARTLLDTRADESTELLEGIGADRDEAAALGVRVVELEKRIAALHWDLVRSRDAVARYNPMTHDRLTELFPLADAWLEGVDSVSVTSGASVPDELVAGVLAFLTERGYPDAQAVHTAEESLIFALPPELRRRLGP